MAGRGATIFGDGEQTRDYVFVGDVVNANIAAVENPSMEGPFNIGTGRGTSVNMLVDSLKRIGGDEASSFEVDYADARAGEVQHISLDTSKAAQELQWQAKVDLDEGLEQTLASLR